MKFAEYREGNLGTLKERLWHKGIAFKMPERESKHCWFVSNIDAVDQDTEPKFLSRSLASLRIHLKELRVATTSKIQNEYERRVQKKQRSGGGAGGESEYAVL